MTESVKNLKAELESTFIEEISVYFDINPHDGLRDTIQLLGWRNSRMIPDLSNYTIKS